MKIQSLSVVVPTHNKCVNNCKFCVSRTHTNPYEDRINHEAIIHAEANNKIRTGNSNSQEAWRVAKAVNSCYSIKYKDYFNRLQFARDNGCNVVVLTGTGEPIQNQKFLDFFSEVNSTLTTPFKSIEMQTTGVMLDDDTLIHLREIGVTTISFSISNIFDNDRNLEIIECADKLKFDVFEVIKLVKKYDFNLRLSLNLVNDYDKYSVRDVIQRCVDLGADQVTFRKLYKSKTNNKIDQWIENNASKDFYDKLATYTKTNGLYLGVLPFGPKMYNIKEMSVIIDDNCMSENEKNESNETYKYLILRENAKLYFKWETKSSLVF